MFQSSFFYSHSSVLIVKLLVVMQFVIIHYSSHLFPHFSLSRLVPFIFPPLPSSLPLILHHFMSPVSLSVLPLILHYLITSSVGNSSSSLRNFSLDFWSHWEKLRLWQVSLQQHSIRVSVYNNTSYEYQSTTTHHMSVSSQDMAWLT